MNARHLAAHKHDIQTLKMQLGDARAAFVFIFAEVQHKEDRASTVHVRGILGQAVVAVPILVQHHPGMWLCVDNSTCCQQADASCEVCFKGQRCLLQHVCDLCAPALADVSMCVYLGVCKHVAAAFPHFFLLEAKGGWDWELRGTKLSLQPRHTYCAYPPCPARAAGDTVLVIRLLRLAHPGRTLP